MQRSFQVELETIKGKYEESVDLVTDASKNLGQLFKDKMIKMKTKLTKIFAEMDIKVSQNNQDLQQMTGIFKNW